MAIKELGHVVLYVSDLKRSINFYERILGFPLIVKNPGMAMFSTGRTHHELLLIEVGKKKKTKEIQAGLYHIGFKIGDSDKELQEVYKTLLKEEVKIVGATDHGVTHSLYILDPDGIELELYVDMTDAWKKDPSLIAVAPKPIRWFKQISLPSNPNFQNQ